MFEEERKMQLDGNTYGKARAGWKKFLWCCVLVLVFVLFSQSVQASEASEDGAVQTDTQAHVLESGDTASSILSPYLASQDIYALSRACQGVYPLTKLRVGQPYRVSVQNGVFSCLRYDIDDWTQLVVERNGDGFSARTEDIPLDIVRETVSGEVMLYRGFSQAVREAGGDRELALRLADIFAFEFNAWRGVRKGDSFTVYVEKKYRRGELVGYGRILAATFVYGGKTYEAFWFRTDDGRASYYDAGGKNLQPYLRAPLETYLLTSGYASRRLHPVTKRWQPHYAIDYAAPCGTEVYAACDGEVVRIKRDRKAGRYICIKHAGDYETTYMHLSGFAEGLAVGDKVVQGQIIGYVGSTGYATGPHLDFRLKKGRMLVNPRSNHKLHSPDLAEKYKRQLRRKVFAGRVRMGTTRIAQHGNPSSS